MKGGFASGRTGLFPGVTTRSADTADAGIGFQSGSLQNPHDLNLASVRRCR